MHLIATAIERETPDLIKNNVSLRVIGDASRMPADTLARLERCVRDTSAGTGLTLVLAISYSSRWEITDAARGEAEAPLAPLVVGDGNAQVVAVEIGPVYVGDVEFGVCYLPQQEVADAHVASGAYEQVGVRHECRGEVSGYGFVCDAGGVDASGGRFGGYASCGVGDFPA